MLGQLARVLRTSSRFDWFCRCLLLAALMVPLPTSLDGVWVELWVREDSGRGGRGMCEAAPGESKSGNPRRPIVLLGVPLKVPVCDIIQRGMSQQSGERKVEREENKQG